MVSSENTDDLLARGTERMKRRDFEHALDCIERYIEKAPDDPEGWLGLGRTHLLRGEVDRAVPALESAWRKTGAEAEALYLLFLSQAAGGRAAECAELLAHIRNQAFLNSYDSLRSVVYSQNRNRLRRWLALVRSLSGLLRCYPLPTALHLLFLKPGKHSCRLAADALWAARRQLFPDEVLEIILRERSRFLGSRDSKNTERLAYLLLSMAEAELCQAISREGELAFPDKWVFPLLMGHAAFLKEDYAEASALYERTVQKPGGSWLARLHLGASLVFEGKIDEGKRIFRSTADDFPDHPVAAFCGNLRERMLASLPKARCIAWRLTAAGSAVPAEALDEFLPKHAQWGPSSHLVNAPEWNNWREGRRNHRCLLDGCREVPCPACTSEKIEFFMVNRATGMRLGRCRDCGHVFASPMPKSESLQSLYGETYFRIRDQYALAVKEFQSREEAPPSHPTYEEPFEWMTEVDCGKWEESRGKGRTALDVGCASGACLITLRNRGWNVMGQDIGGDYEDYYKALGIPFWNETVERMDLEEESLDLCTMIHVIEHLPYPAETVERIAEWLKPGGRLFIMTPCCGTISAWLGGKSWFYMTEHVQFFTPHSLRTLIGSTGLEILYWRTRVGFRYETPFRVWRRYRIGGSLQDMLEKMGQGDVIDMVCEKPTPSIVA